MRLTWIALIVLAFVPAVLGSSADEVATLPQLPPTHLHPPTRDWLLDPAQFKAGLFKSADGKELVLSNGLVRRHIRLAPNAATVALDSTVTTASLLRAVRPEAVLQLDGKTYPVGGLTGQPVQNYLKREWLDNLKSEPGAFTFQGFESGPTQARFAWKPRAQWMPEPGGLPWPPPGVGLTLEFKPPADGPDVAVEVHYELYDGLPLLCKWITVRAGPKPVRLNAFKAEILAAVEPESSVDFTPRWESPSFHVETDMAFDGMNVKGASPAVAWKPDPLYRTQVNYELQTPCLLECAPPIGPDQIIEPGKSFESFHVFELLQDSTDRERRGLAIRRMYRTIAPWVAENPLIFHAASAKPEQVRAAIDQASDVGFDIVLMTFGSGFDAENTSPQYMETYRKLAEYAASKHVTLGGYSLLASRSISPADDVVNPKTGKPGGFARFGDSPCLGSAWGLRYFEKLRTLYQTAGLGVLENDGSYPGDPCASTSHPGHRGYDDSQWNQWRQITGFYQWCRARGIYLNVPDWYFLSGSSKCGMGYRETNWSLPRAEQEIIERQNVFDGTWTKTPSMGWMFVPLMPYHGGGSAATIEPLKEHLDDYQQRLADLLGAGVQACWRGPRLYDAPETRDRVKRWVDWYKRYRSILDSDIIHGRRADGQDLDWILHVNPFLENRALLMVYNPLDEPAERTLRVNLYYAGLRNRARVRQQEGPSADMLLDHNYTIALPVKLPAKSTTWYIVQSGD
jgi:hypothetical protein